MSNGLTLGAACRRVFGLRVPLLALAAFSLVALLSCTAMPEPTVGPSAVATAAVSPSDPCAVASIRRIGPSGGGLDWSRSGNNLILMSRYDENGISQVYTIAPDGSNETCLTCQQAPGGPPVGVHKGVAHWHPSGQYILLDVEAEQHSVQRALAEPGSGRANNIWAMTTDGSRWWQLTNNDANPEAGVLFPVPSHDGTRLAWAERYAGPQKPGQALARFLLHDPVADLWGQWRLNVADLRTGSDGVALANVQSYEPGGASFYEMQAWSPDDQQIYFASEIGQDNVYLLDIWQMDLASQSLRNVTNNPGNWEEHLSISPDGRKFLLDSSACCQWNPKQLKTLRMELTLMNADGSGQRQLTHFNTPGYAESSSQQSVVAKGVWSPDGRQAALQRIVADAKNEQGKRVTDLWILTFAGSCGSQ